MKISLNKGLINKVTKDLEENKKVKDIKYKRKLKIKQLIKEKKENVSEILKNNDEIKIRRRKVLVKEQNNKNIILLFQNFKLIKQNKVFYSIFISMLILTSTTIYINAKMSNDIGKEKYVVLNTKENTVVKTSTNIDMKDKLNNCNNLDTRYENEKKTIQNSINRNNSIKTNNTNNEIKVIKAKEKVLEFIKPIEGKIIKNYSNKELVYSKTLETWKTHEGIDIACNINDDVKSCEDGVIEKIYNDSLYGNTIIISHGKEYKTIYSNVISNLSIKDKVSKNQIIGKLDNSGIVESKEESHLHFVMIYNDEIINPNGKIKF